MNTIRKLLPLLVATLVATAAMSAPPAMAGCLSQGAAQQAIQSGQAQPWSRIQAGLGGAIDGQVTSVQLCQGGGGLVYVVSVLSGDGTVRTLTVSAQSGALM
jgi:uncharacterized membrane protein YkoI